MIKEVSLRLFKATVFTVVVLGIPIGINFLFFKWDASIARAVTFMFFAPAFLVGVSIFTPKRILDIQTRQEEDRILARADQIRAKRRKEEEIENENDQAYART